jgi:hypothetical protein
MNAVTLDVWIATYMFWDICIYTEIIRDQHASKVAPPRKRKRGDADNQVSKYSFIHFAPISTYRGSQKDLSTMQSMRQTQSQRRWAHYLFH